jgi:pimeloyl-ACP methyl ester carboxylesterase
VKTHFSAMAVIASIAIWSASADADNAPAAAPLGTSRPVPAATMTVGTLSVEKYGSGDPAVILMPGLACGSWVWDGTIRALAGTHTVYAVTLAGFSGAAPASGALLDKADASIQQLILQEHLVKPILVGHSLGGFLTIRFAEEHSDELSRAVTVDGLPVFPQLAQMTADERVATSKQFFEPLRKETHDQFVSGENAYVSGMVTDPALAAQVAALVSTSDQNATAEYGEEMFGADLRPGLGQIHTPLLEIVPVPVPKDLPAGFPDAMRQMTPAQLSQAFVAYYGALFPGASTVTFAPIAGARHFAMLDQPTAFSTALESYIDGK